MPRHTAVIGSAVGLHARPASLFSQAVAATGTSVTLHYGEKSANGASILSVLALGVPFGATVHLEGDDEAALEALTALLERDLEAQE